MNPIFQRPDVNPVPGGGTPTPAGGNLSGLAAIAAQKGEDIFAAAAAEAKDAGMKAAAEKIAAAQGNPTAPGAKPARGEKGYIFKSAYYNALKQGNLVAGENQISRIIARANEMAESVLPEERQGAAKYLQEGIDAVLAGIADPENKATLSILRGRVIADFAAKEQSLLARRARLVKFNEETDALANMAANTTISSVQILDGEITSRQEAIGDPSHPFWSELEKVRVAGLKNALETKRGDWVKEKAEAGASFGDIEKRLRNDLMDARGVDVEMVVDGARKDYVEWAAATIGADRMDDLALKLKQNILTVEEVAEARAEFGILAPIENKELFALAEEAGYSRQDFVALIMGEVKGQLDNAANALATAERLKKENEKGQIDVVNFFIDETDKATMGGHGGITSDRVRLAGAAQMILLAPDDKISAARKNKFLTALHLSHPDSQQRSHYKMVVLDELGGISPLDLGQTERDAITKKLLGLLPDKAGHIDISPAQNAAAAAGIIDAVVYDEQRGNTEITKWGAGRPDVMAGLQEIQAGQPGDAAAQIMGVPMTTSEVRQAMHYADNLPVGKARATLMEVARAGAPNDDFLRAVDYLDLPTEPRRYNFGKDIGAQHYIEGNLALGYTRAEASIIGVAQQHNDGLPTTDEKMEAVKTQLGLKGWVFDGARWKMPLARGYTNGDVFADESLWEQGLVRMVVDTGYITTPTHNTKGGTLADLVSGGTIDFAFSGWDGNNALFAVVDPTSRAAVAIDEQAAVLEVDMRVLNATILIDRIEPLPNPRPTGRERLF